MLLIFYDYLALYGLFFEDMISTAFQNQIAPHTEICIVQPAKMLQTIFAL